MKTKKVIEVSDWDALVVKTYGRPYNLQQQDGCKDRGTEAFTVPSKAKDCYYKRKSVPEKVNGEEMGVSFEAWLARDPKQKLPGPNDQNDWSLELWWERNFYPDLQMVGNDLHSKGLIEAGNHTILIDW